MLRVQSEQEQCTEEIPVGTDWEKKKAGFRLELMKQKSKGEKRSCLHISKNNIPQFHNVSVNC